jgi:hypothetical protein
MAFVQMFEKVIHKRTQMGVQFVKIILRIFTVIEKSVDIKMQCRKFGAGLNDQIGITRQIGYYKFVDFDIGHDRDFNGFVSCSLATAN